MLMEEERRAKAIILNRNRKAIFHINRYMMDFHPEVETEVITEIDMKYNYSRDVVTGYNVTQITDPNYTLDDIIKNGIVYYVSYYPKRTVSVSGGPSTTINDLYSFIKIQDNRFMKLAGIVTTYDYDKAVSGYAFSHLPSVYLTQGCVPRIETCCLGTSNLSNIHNNMMLIPEDQEDDLFYIIAMNCYELFSVESATSTPYIRLSSISAEGYSPMVISCDINAKFPRCSNIVMHAINRTINELVLSNKIYVNLGARGYIKFKDVNNFSIDRNRMNFTYFMIDSARIMKKYIVEACVLFGYGKQMADTIINSILSNVYIGKRDGKIMLFNDYRIHNPNSFSSINGRFLFKFKGRDVFLDIAKKDSNKSEYKAVSILNNSYLHPMYTAYLKSMIKFKTYA